MDEKERETVRQAMSIISRVNSDAQTEARRVNMAKAVAARTGKPMREEHKAALRQAQAERRARERLQRDAENPPQPKRPVGRPKKVLENAENTLDIQ